MLTIHVFCGEHYNSADGTFSYDAEYDIELEHSLLSISKWEQKYHKPFLDEHTPKTNDEVFNYIKMMTLNKVPDEAYKFITPNDIQSIKAYIKDPATATTIQDHTPQKDGRGISKAITNEQIYYMMFANQIPKECELWHLNHLTTLLRVFNVNNSSQKKMSAKEGAQRRHAANKRRQGK